MPLRDNTENGLLWCGVEITITNKKRGQKKKKGKKIKATRPSIMVKARIKFAHALKKDAQHSHIAPGFNNPPVRGDLSQGIHEDSD